MGHPIALTSTAGSSSRSPNYNLPEGIAIGTSIEATANWDDDDVWNL
jgi:hypothetical protein